MSPRYLSAALLLLATGCMKPLPPATPEPARAPMRIGTSFGRAWDAVIDAFADRGISVETLDRSSGLIVPAGRTYVAKQYADAIKYADCGYAMKAQPYAPSSVKYNVVVRGDSSASTVQVRAFYESTLSPFHCVSTGLYELGAEMAIKERAESGAKK